MSDTPGMERRLLLAFGLMILVIVGWPKLALRMGWIPQAQSPQNGIIVPQITKKVQESGSITPLINQKQHIIGSIETQATSLGFSAGTGSIASIQSDAVALLVPEDGPGLGAVAWTAPPVAWAGWSPGPISGPDPQMTYVGEPEPGVTAFLQYHGVASQNLLQIVLTVTNRTDHPQTVQPRLLAGRFLHDPLDHGRYRLLRVHVGGKIRSLPPTLSAGEQRWEGPVGWVTAQTKYSATIVEPTTAAEGILVTRDLHGQSQAWLQWPAATVPPGGVQTWTVRLYAGPLDYRFLDPLRMDHAASLGAFTTITRLLQSAMNGLTRIFHSYGAAIVALTVLLSAGFSPLTWTSFRAMKTMERIQPVIKGLQERYKSDPRRLNEEVMKVYKQHRVNPLSGCLPLLFQMPIFIALYQVLSRSTDLRGAKFLLIKDLSAPDALIPLPAPLPLLGPAVNILPLAMAGMMWLQQRQSSHGRALTEEQRAQQQVMGFMPILFGVMFYALPSGLVLYWLLNTSLVVLQQRLMLRRLA